jgi:hypothetical protein
MNRGTREVRRSTWGRDTGILCPAETRIVIRAAAASNQIPSSPERIPRPKTAQRFDPIPHREPPLVPSS